MKRAIVVAAVFAFTDCGGGGGLGGASLGLTALPGRTILPASLRFQGLSDVAVVGGEDGSSAVFWVQPSDVGSAELLGQRLLGLQPQGATDVLTAVTRNASRPSACRGGSGVVVAWTDYADDLPVGQATEDESNVVARLAWPGAEPTQVVNDPHLLGQQDSRWVACLDSGETVYSWYSLCTAVRYRSGEDFRFVPAACANEPADGTYLRSFAADGQPTGEAVSRGLPQSFGTIAAGAGDSFVLLSGSSLQTWRANEVVQQVADPGAFGWETSMTCVGSRCVAAAPGGELLLFDSTNLASRERFVFQETSEPVEDVTIRAAAPYLACDAAGTCVVTWVLQRETLDYDVIETVRLGVHARAFDLDTGRMGEPLEIAAPSPEAEEYGARIVSTGSGRFLVVRVPGEDIELSELVVGQ